MSRELYLEVVDVLNTNPTCHRHTYYQIKHFILNKETTHQGRMRKCLNEMEARKNTIDNIALSIEEAKDDILLADIEIKRQQENLKNLENELDKSVGEISVRKAERRKMGLESTLQDLGRRFRECEEETTFFLHAYRQLEKVEDLKPYDDPESAAKFWNEQYAEELQLRLMLQKPLDLELVKCILAMDKDAPIRTQMINILEQIQGQAKAQQNRRTEMDRSIESVREEEITEETSCQKESQH